MRSIRPIAEPVIMSAPPKSTSLERILDPFPVRFRRKLKRADPKIRPFPR